ncbi:30S ribosomal protein S6e [Candidatus Woesearchaeota archaeon]|nr:30S ribosomal protein S6e [Candidatus Woesearchaeota archaeon]
MAEFKLVIGDPKSGKCHQVVVSEGNADFFKGKKIGDKVRGESFDFPGYEFEITGGADYCGFPMRKDIEGPVRKKVLIVDGVGTRHKEKGIRKRRTVCGNTIHEKITQISLKVLKHGKKPLGEPAEELADAEAPKEVPAEDKKE